MRRRKKRNMIIWFSIVSVVVFVLVLMLIINRIKDISTGQLSVNYSAGKNIQSTITGSYSINQGEKIILVAEDGANKLEFNTENTEVVETKNFKKVTNLTIKKDDVIIVQYTIKNNNQYYSLIFNAEADLVKCSNIIVEYSTNKTDWQSSIAGTLGLSGRPIANNQQINFYIKINVNRKTTDAKFDGCFNFMLTTVQ